VVLVGDASDTRAYRLPWPTGTCIYHVAGASGHRWAAEALSAADLHVKRGCLMRRVEVDLAGGEAGWAEDKLVKQGFQPDKESVFAIQGLTELGVEQDAVDVLLGEIGSVAALNSVVVGEMPPLDCRADDLLAQHGLLGWPFAYSDEDLGALRTWRADWGAGADEYGRRRLLFRATQQFPSIRQVEIVEAFRSEFGEVDEDLDLSDNFS